MNCQFITAAGSTNKRVVKVCLAFLRISFCLMMTHSYLLASYYGLSDSCQRFAAPLWRHTTVTHFSHLMSAQLRYRYHYRLFWPSRAKGQSGLGRPADRPQIAGIEVRMHVCRARVLNHQLALLDYVAPLHSDYVDLGSHWHFSHYRCGTSDVFYLIPVWME